MPYFEKQDCSKCRRWQKLDCSKCNMADTCPGAVKLNDLPQEGKDYVVKVFNLFHSYTTIKNLVALDARYCPDGLLFEI
jgi:hypothetical protein